jgi:hypothetical protein
MNKYIFALASLSFFPYLSTGVRGEYVVLLLLFFPVFCYSLLKYGHNIFVFHLLKTFGLTFALFFLVISSLTSSVSGLDANPITMFARVAMPAIMFFVFSVILRNIENTLVKTTSVLSMFGAVAGAVSLCSALFDLSEYLSPWVSNNDSESVWAQANGLGRFTGIFNQPLEAGIFFFITSLSSLVVLNGYCFKNRKYHYLFLFFSVLGGLLSLSKNYSLLGLPILILFALSINLISYKITFLISLITTAILSIYLIYFNDVYLESFILLYNDFGFLNALSAGRYGSNESAVANLFNDVLVNNLLLGFGLGSKLPLDSGYLEYFYQGGLFALLGYLFFLLHIFISAFNARLIISKNLLYTLLIYIVIASFGGPVITANRANILLFILISSILISEDAKKS